MFKRLSEQDHYQVLEVPYDATTEEIQRAYDAVREIYQSDALVAGSILTPDERRAILDRLSEAYQTLIAEESRRFYNEALSESSPALRTVLSPRTEPSAPGRALAALAIAQSTPRLVKSPPAARKRALLTLRDGEEATGEFLRRAREAAGLDLRSIAEETKISATTLTHIEQERLDRLPAHVYLRSFVTQYARCLGLEEERVAGSYLARVNRLQGGKR